jgi:phosphoribosylamine-glycine ligase
LRFWVTKTTIIFQYFGFTIAINRDKGPNTGGMGAYSPAPIVTDEIFQDVMDSVIRPTVLYIYYPSSPLKEFLSAEQALSKDPNLLPTDFRHGVHFQISVTHVFSQSWSFR